MDNLDRQLRYFLLIAECKSLSKAADMLEQNQSWISKQLATLEAYLGKPLFVRHGRGVEFTEAGQKLFATAQPAYRDIDRGLQSIRQIHGVTQGTVRLATVHTLNYYFVSDVVRGLMEAHPNVNMSLLERSSPDVVALIEANKADIGFVYDTAVNSAQLNVTTLFDDFMCLIVRRDACVGTERGVDLRVSNLRLVGFPEHYALRRMTQGAGLHPDYVAEAETIDAVLRLVSSGVGAAILPARLPDKLLAEYELKKVRIAEPILSRRVVVITHCERRSLPIVDDLKRCALKVAQIPVARLE